MHISEGVLNPNILVVGGVLSLAGVALSLRRIETKDIPKTAMLSAVFFVASFIHAPVGPSSAHLVLSGLLAAILGRHAFTAVLAGLFLQGVLFNFGGITTLGVNTFNIAAPAVFYYALLSGFLLSPDKRLSVAASFLIGFLSVISSAFLVALCLYLSGGQFLLAAKTVLLLHLPIALIEGLVTVACIYFLRKVKPDILPEGFCFWRKSKNNCKEPSCAP